MREFGSEDSVEISIRYLISVTGLGVSKYISLNNSFIMFTMCYTRFSITDLSLFRKSELRDEGGNKMGKIMAVNISEKKGTQKKNVHSARLMEEFGIEKDAHAGKWHRQVSLLSYEKIEEFKAKGAPIEDGAFGENLIVSGYDLKALPVGTRLRSGEVLLEVTQIGKKCHSGCEIYKIMGDCIMPREGIFTRVLHGGVLTEGDEIVIEKAAGEADGE